MQWRVGFTNDFPDLDHSLANLVSCADAPGRKDGKEEKEKEGVQFTEVFSQLEEHVKVQAAVASVQEQCTTRYVLVYCRSSQVPRYPSSRPLFCSPAGSSLPSTHLDALFLHHKLSTHRECAQACQETLDVLSVMQRGGTVTVVQ